jgi:hypothetical protein
LSPPLCAGSIMIRSCGILHHVDMNLVVINFIRNQHWIIINYVLTQPWFDKDIFFAAQKTVFEYAVMYIHFLYTYMCACIHECLWHDFGSIRGGKLHSAIVTKRAVLKLVSLQFCRIHCFGRVEHPMSWNNWSSSSGLHFRLFSVFGVGF